MKRKLISVVMVGAVLLSLTLTGCEDKPNRTVNTNGSTRFIFTGQEFYISGDSGLSVVEDTETKILYLKSFGDGGGMTPWLDADGKPMKSDIKYEKGKPISITTEQKIEKK